MNKKGFSLTETLVAILITSFLTLMVAAGTATGIKGYWEVVSRTQAQSLYTEYIEELKAGLGSADLSAGIENARTSTGKTYTNVFFSRKYDVYGTYVSAEYSSGVNVIAFQPLVKQTSYWTELDRIYIVSVRSSITGVFNDKEITTDFTNFTYANGRWTGSLTMRVNGEEEILASGTFSIVPVDELIK